MGRIQIAVLGATILMSACGGYTPLTSEEATSKARLWRSWETSKSDYAILEKVVDTATGKTVYDRSADSAPTRMVRGLYEHNNQVIDVPAPAEYDIWVSCGTWDPVQQIIGTRKSHIAVIPGRHWRPDGDARLPGGPKSGQTFSTCDAHMLMLKP